MCSLTQKGRFFALFALFTSVHLRCTQHVMSVLIGYEKAGQIGGHRGEDEENGQQHGLGGLDQTLSATVSTG